MTQAPQDPSQPHDEPAPHPYDEAAPQPHDEPAPHPYDEAAPQPYDQPTPQPYGSPDPNPYAAPVQPPYAAPVQQPYAGSAQAPYATPVQQPYGNPGQQYFGAPVGPNAVAPYYQGQPVYPGARPTGGKSKVAAGVLGIFLGSLGIHNFYLGNTTKGVIQLLITVLSVGFLSWVSAIWGLIEGIMILVSKPGDQWHRDASGYELSD